MQQERLSYASGPSTQPLLGMTIGEQFDQACRQYAEKGSNRQFPPKQTINL